MLYHNFLVERVEQHYGADVRDGSAYLFYLDITDFHLVNRLYGTQGGDRLLAATEAYITALPDVKVCERVFCDQFVFLTVYDTPKTETEIRERFARKAAGFVEQVRNDFPNCAIGMSCGIYALLHERSVTDAIDGARLALKEAKRTKSEVPVIFDPAMVEQIFTRREREKDLNAALNSHRFTYYLQPKVDLETGKVVGTEALVRLIEEDGTICDPGSFIDIMEGNGSVVDLDLQVLEMVCRDLAERVREEKPVAPVSVNLSRLHTQIPTTAEIIRAIVAKYAVNPALLQFELTERILIDDFTKTKQLINQLREAGFRVSIDDFGSGYNGINIWQQLDFDVLKLDKIFLTEEEPIKSRNLAIVPNIIDIANRLHIMVLCEGAETKEQCAYLMEMGCHIVQGYFFSKPLPKEAFYETFERQNGAYPLPFPAEKKSKKESRTEKREPIREKKRRGAGRWSALLLTLLTVLTLAAVCTVTLIRAYRTAGVRGTALGDAVKFTVVLAAIILVATILVFLYLIRLREQANDEGNRYSLLENFADIILFEYTPKTDTMRFTSNVGEIFATEQLPTKGFLEHLYNSKHTLFADLPVWESVLCGRMKAGVSEVRVRCIGQKGRPHWCMINFKYLYTDRGVLSCVIGRISDVDGAYEKECVLEAQATRDSMTGLYNYGTTLTLIGQAMEQSDNGFMMMLDVDNFKRINDTYGHDMGNSALRILTSCLMKCFGTDDVVGRVGGDEILVFMRSESDFHAAAHKIETLWNLLQCDSLSCEIGLTVSVGIVARTKRTTGFDTLFHMADQAMYDVKKSGKSGYSFLGKVYALGSSEKNSIQKKTPQKKTR